VGILITFFRLRLRIAGGILPRKLKLRICGSFLGFLGLIQCRLGRFPSFVMEDWGKAIAKKAIRFLGQEAV
jgi:hypothetical protein